LKIISSDRININKYSLKVVRQKKRNYKTDGTERCVLDSHFLSFVLFLRKKEKELKLGVFFIPQV
jgi:hypothetical protein